MNGIGSVQYILTFRNCEILSLGRSSQLEVWKAVLLLVFSGKGGYI